MDTETPREDGVTTLDPLKKITEQDLKELTGLDDQVTEYAGTVLAGVFMGAIAMVPIGFIIAACWGLFFGFSTMTFFKLFQLSAAISSSVFLVYIVRDTYNTRKITRRIAPLLQEVRRYNTLVEQIETLDKLESVGHQIHVEKRSAVINTLHAMHQEIVRALKTERILRDKPSSDFTLDLTPFHALSFQEQTEEYAQFINDTLEIGMQVRQDLTEADPQ